MAALWAFSRFDLHLSDQEFWRTTVGHIMALRERWLAYEDRANLRAGLVAATILNVHRRPGAPPVKADAFFTRQLPPPAQTPRQILRTIELLNAAFGGRDLRTTEALHG